MCLIFCSQTIETDNKQFQTIEIDTIETGQGGFMHRLTKLGENLSVMPEAEKLDSPEPAFTTMFCLHLWPTYNSVLGAWVQRYRTEMYWRTKLQNRYTQTQTNHL